MKFQNLNPPYLDKGVAAPVAKYCVSKYGRSGFKCQEELKENLQWRPTIQLRISRFTVMAIEVSEILYPAILKSVSHDLKEDYSDSPVVVCAACPLAVYQADARHVVTSQLRAHGFGIITVDDLGNVIEQFSAIPLIHHISENDFVVRCRSLPSTVRIQARQAYDTYRTNSYQGLQDIAQVVEALIFGFAKSALDAGWISALKKDAAYTLDDLYGSSERRLTSQRAAIGAARGFVRYFRNVSSHPPRTARDAASLIKSCREGMMQAIQVACQLATAIRACGFRVRLYIP